MTAPTILCGVARTGAAIGAVDALPATAAAGTDPVGGDTGIEGEVLDDEATACRFPINLINGCLPGWEESDTFGSDACGALGGDFAPPVDADAAASTEKFENASTLSFDSTVTCIKMIL